jgi:hypothetical protein
MVVMSAPVMARDCCFIGTNDVCVDAFGRLVSCFDGFDGINGNRGDIDLVGSSINMSPTLDNNVTQTIGQSAAG